MSYFSVYPISPVYPVYSVYPVYPVGSSTSGHKDQPTNTTTSDTSSDTTTTNTSPTSLDPNLGTNFDVSVWRLIKSTLSIEGFIFVLFPKLIFNYSTPLLLFIYLYRGDFMVSLILIIFAIIFILVSFFTKAPQYLIISGLFLLLAILFPIFNSVT